MNVVIHHNPDCGTSRNVLQIIRDAGYTPTVVEYLKTGWTRPQLLALFAAANLTPRDALRVTKSPAAELGLMDQSVAGAALLDAMLEHPVLVNRPIVACRNGVRLCRPSEAVLDLLDVWPTGPYSKEDGTPILDANGRRLNDA
ncbi:MAG: arsenate reductase (glutaredoxin) [Pseudomonadota bacterium]